MNRPVHFEILADDPQKVADFYRRAFGWEITAWQGPQAYWLVKTGADGEAGINGGIMGKALSQAVINTIAVSSLEGTLAKIVEAGGELAQGPNEIPGIGLHAYCCDPEGNLFGVLQPSGM